MTVLPFIHRNTAIRALLRRALRKTGVRVLACKAFERLHTILQRDLVDGVVVDVRDGQAERAFALVKQFPRIPVFALSAFRPDDGRLLAACHDAPLRGILVEGVDDSAASALIAPRLATPARAAALADGPKMLRLTEPLQVQAWQAVLSHAGQPTTTIEIAGAIGRTREHLSREFAAGGAPNLKRVIDLARAAWAADLLANPGYTIGTVARILGYSSPSHLTGSARRVTGLAARDLARLGPRGVLLRFVRGRTRSRL